ncbi:MFS transporter [Burkholderia sp. L27(2015)]|uniref:MFS transporter n=1 Tax=Burkholderia sp. L27(2015) TaxID=1641858 RepID=UPI00131B885D|nr:MFS transporter [Burkholderia sp. L27(2015)]
MEDTVGIARNSNRITGTHYLHLTGDTALRRVIGAVIVGNCFEWFDYIAYSFFSVVIAKLFFPTEDPVISLLLTLGTLGVGLFVRPLGGLWLGAYADRVGRNAALTLTITLMTVGTALIALAPTYAQIGIAAPVIIVLARLLQGFAVGGEMGSAAALLIERIPPNRQNYYTSWIQAGVGMSILLSAGFGFYLTSQLDPSALNSWGWRMPFLLGILLGPIGLYIRRQVANHVQAGKSSNARTPLREIFHLHLRSTITGMGLTALWTICSYVLLFYIPTYSAAALHLPIVIGFSAVLVGGLTAFCLTPIMGFLADRHGARRFLVGAAASIFALAYPMFALINVHPGIVTLLMFQLVFGVLIACYEGAVLAVLANLFPNRVRSSGIAVSYNAAVILFGGFAAVILTWLIAVTGSNLAPAFYVMGAAAISALAGICYRNSEPGSN